MFLKKKCPNCGAKNDKERMTCIECGAPFASGQVAEQLTHVSTSSGMQAKEKERQEDIAWHCDECGAKIVESDTSCPACGVEFEEEG